jgi:alpha/beta superfamily hydrolase
MMRKTALLVAMGFVMAVPYQASSADDLATVAQPIQISTHDGVALSGRYYAAASPGQGLLLLSMCDPSEDQTQWASLATSLTESGFHVLTFDYRGFGTSRGSMPKGLTSLEEAIIYWRTEWIKDVENAYQVLRKQPLVTDIKGLAGASCGVVLGVEMAMQHPTIESIVLISGPTDQTLLSNLKARPDLPIFAISENENMAYEWIDGIFSASINPKSKLIKYKTTNHGRIFGFNNHSCRNIIGFILIFTCNRRNP